MGDETDAQEMTKVLSQIFRIDWNELDIGDRNGWTSYIDFIKPDDVGDEHGRKGKDANGRAFIAFKSNVRIQGETIRMFTTFFQRYVDHDMLYHTAGHYGIHLFETSGGASLVQMRLLCDLLHSGTVDITTEQASQCRVGYKCHTKLAKMDPGTIHTITLGWPDEE
jgi:hypothetical protein